MSIRSFEDTVYALGRFEGRLYEAAQPELRIFAALTLQAMLIRALRQQGFAFTPERYSEWRAGLMTLCDTSHPHGTSAHAITRAVLVELSHSPWRPLANVASGFLAAFLAPQDGESEIAHEEALETIAEARRYVESHSALPRSGLIGDMAGLYTGLDNEFRFAPEEPGVRTIELAGKTVRVEQPPRPAPLWALELFGGQWLSSRGLGSLALPFPELFRVDVIQAKQFAREHSYSGLDALNDSVLEAIGRLDRARSLAKQVANLAELHSASSRAPQLYEILACFGALRSVQLEHLIGASRLGVRSMIASLRRNGCIVQRQVAGVVLYNVALPSPSLSAAGGSFAINEKVLSDFDEAMALAERALDRVNISNAREV